MNSERSFSELEKLAHGAIHPSSYSIGQAADDHRRNNNITQDEVEYCLEIDQLIGFQGKRVLQIGQSLPESFVLNVLKVNSWTVVNESNDKDFRNLSEAERAPYNVVSDQIIHLPPEYHSQFDLVFSVSTFQGIQALPLALDKMYDALSPGGDLAASVESIWSSKNGHQIIPTTDAVGRPYSSEQENCPIPDWGHLLYSRPMLYFELSKKMDRETASEIVYSIYSSPHINRFFADEYRQCFELSCFGRLGDIHSNVKQQNIHPELQQILERKYPGKRNFNSDAIKVHFKKRQ
jgi:hypothetical protein